MKGASDHSWLRALPLIWACALALAPCGCKEFLEKHIGSTSKPASKPTPPTQERVEDYVGALRAANEFCQAWQRGEYTTYTRNLMSQRMLKQHSEEKILNTIGGGLNPRHAAYELSEGRRLDDGRYAFKLKLYFWYAGGTSDRTETVPGEMILAREASDRSGQWKVDQFPMQ
jgi:hypothetical protein